VAHLSRSLVRESLLCNDLPAPPPDVPKARRFRLCVDARAAVAARKDPSCSGCHNLMDPIGFGFRSFRRGWPLSHDDGDSRLIRTQAHRHRRGRRLQRRDGARAKLAGSEQVRQCVARQWFRFAMTLRAGHGRLHHEEHRRRREAAGTSLSALPQALVTSDAFMYRRPVN